MKKAILQIWEESHCDDKIIPNGATLHLEISDRNEFVDNIYKFRDKKRIPEVYKRVSGDFSEVLISEDMFNKLKIFRNITLKEHEFNNLINFKEIV